jgi:hypothetical protein
MQHRMFAAGVLALSAMLGGCGMFSSAPDTVPVADGDSATGNAADQAVFPPKIGGFSRVNVLHRGQGKDLTAGYVFEEEGSTLSATLRIHTGESGFSLLPSFGGSDVATENASSRELANSIAQIRHYYPNATVSAESPVMVVQQGMFQNGRTATVQYEDLLGGQRQKIAMQVYMFCCTTGHVSYEYRFRHPAGQNADYEITRFINASTWPMPKE